MFQKYSERSILHCGNIAAALQVRFGILEKTREDRVLLHRVEASPMFCSPERSLALSSLIEK